MAFKIQSQKITFENFHSEEASKFLVYIRTVKIFVRFLKPIRAKEGLMVF